MDKDISLRKYPYPFKAAFCFSNDIDLTTVERYLFLKDLFRNFPPSSPSTEPGLPYSESFFVFNHNPFHPEQISLKSHPDLMIPDIESGYLSTLHSWGDYNFNPLFSREHAKQGFEMLSGFRVKPRVWVNHGTTHNFQNIGAGIGYGDAKEYVDGAGTSYPLSTYHLDYIRKLGIEFYWISNPSRVIGQNVKLNAGRYWEAYYADSEESGDLKSTMLRLAKRYLYLPLKVKGVSNRLLQTRTMRDGS